MVQETNNQTFQPPVEPKKKWYSKHHILGYVFLLAVISAAVSVVYYLKVKNVYVDITPIIHRDPTKGWKTFSSQGFGFEFKYPSDLSVYQLTDLSVPPSTYIPVCDSETMIGCLFYPQEKYPGTNFEGAGLSVNLIKTANTESKCLSYQGKTMTEKKQVNGVEFYYAEGGEGAAGHLSTDKIYRTFQSPNCLEIDLRVNQSQFANYEPGMIKEFTTSDQAQVFNILSYVLSTFKFISKNEKPDPIWETYNDSAISFKYPKTLCGTSWQEDWDLYSCDNPWRVEASLNSVAIFPAYSSFGVEFGGDIEIVKMKKDDFDKLKSEHIFNKKVNARGYSIYSAAGLEGYPDRIDFYLINRGDTYLSISNNFPDRYPRYMGYLLDSLIIK